MTKKKNKQLIRPWCWYCEREFEDEKVLMQHQKAKHFKCGMCPRRLNTAGGLAVHIQQVHKLEPENLPRIENALPGRDGYEVEIFGMEGIPAPDVADYKRRKEIELGLAAGSISQPQAKRPKIENRVIPEEELRRQLVEHRALMGLNNPEPAATAQESVSAPAVYAAPQTYSAPPLPVPGIPAGAPPVPPPFPPGPHGAMMPGVPFPPTFPPGMPPGMPPGAPPGFPMQLPPNLPPGMVAFPPGLPGNPPFPPSFAPPPNLPPDPSLTMGVPHIPSSSLPPPVFVPSQSAQSSLPPPVDPEPQQGRSGRPPRREEQRQPILNLPNPSLAQTNPEFKKPTDLKVKDANFSPDEHRAVHPKYFLVDNSATSAPEEPRGKKRARAEDFL